MLFMCFFCDLFLRCLFCFLAFDINSYNQKETMMTKIKLLTISSIMAMSIFVNDSHAADIGTVICESSSSTAELTVNISGITWNDWWDHESVQAHGFTQEGRIISFDPQRLNPSKQNYFFSYNGPYQINSIKTYVTTNMIDIEVSCS